MSAVPVDMTGVPASTTTGTERPGPFRLTRRVFWDLAVYMVGLGLTVGLVFPVFAVLMGIPARYATRPLVIVATLGAGFLVGAVNYALCRVVVGGRLAVLSARLRDTAARVTQSNRVGEPAVAAPSRIDVDSDDELGETVAAFNSVLDALDDGEHFRSLVRNSSDVITVVDRAGTITYQTPSVREVLGYLPDAMVGSDIRSYVHPEDAGVVAEFLDGVIDRSVGAQPLEARARHLDGRWLWVETVASNLLDEPAVNGLVLTTRDVTDRKALEMRLHAQAFHDSLTGLPNRAQFMDRLHAAHRELVSRGTPLAVLFIDLDNLKTTNDTLGHEVGDALLRGIAVRILACIDPPALIARLSGDEFAVLLTGADSEERALSVSDDVLRSLHEPLRFGDGELHAGVSIGVACSRTCEETGISALRAADLAMYVAKTSGKGRRVVFQPRHHVLQLEQERLRTALHGALDANQLSLHYQPVVDLRTGRTTGFEALLRWNDPALGNVPPARFIPVAEESGLIVPIGRWVTEQAARQAALWAAQGRPCRVNVNVSARQLRHPTFVADVARVLDCTGVDPGLLTLEITESLLMEQTETTLATLASLKETGVSLALDDFGTGYSSLSYLRRLPVDVLKIDKSFVDDVAKGSADRAVVEAIIRLGRSLDLAVVAEGIEHADQVTVLAELGCPLGQGYHFSVPVPADQALPDEPAVPAPRRATDNPAETFAPSVPARPVVAEPR